MHLFLILWACFALYATADECADVLGKIKGLSPGISVEIECSTERQSIYNGTTPIVRHARGILATTAPSVHARTCVHNSQIDNSVCACKVVCASRHIGLRLAFLFWQSTRNSRRCMLCPCIHAIHAMQDEMPIITAI